MVVSMHQRVQLRRGIRQQLSGRVELEQPALGHDEHPGALEHADHPVRYEQHGGAAERAADRVEDQPLGFLVEVRCCFVY